MGGQSILGQKKMGIYNILQVFHCAFQSIENMFGMIKVFTMKQTPKNVENVFRKTFYNETSGNENGRK